MSDSTPTETPTTPPVSPASPKKKRLAKTLCTARIPFKKQLDIISAIPIASDKCGGSVTFKDVGDVVGLSEATLLQISAFLTDVGLIKRVEGSKFLPAPELQEFDRIRGFSAEKAWQKLAPIFERSWFGQELMPRLKLRELNEVDAIHTLAEVSMAEKEHQEQLEIGIQYLERVGLVIREGGMLKIGTPVQQNEQQLAKDPVTTPPSPLPVAPADIEIEGLEKHSLTLDPKAGRKVVIFAPPTLKTKELERLQSWLGFQFIIDDEL